MSYLLDEKSILHFLESRRSQRQFGRGEVSQDVVEEIVQAAGWAPSPHKTRPWRFVVVSSPAARRNLVLKMGEAFDADLERDGLSDERRRARIKKSHDLLLAASVLIVACISMEGMDRYPDPPRRAAEETMAAQSLGAATQNILLAAHAKGIAACWVCAPLFCPQVVHRTLDLPLGYVAHVLLALGPLPSEVPPPRPPYQLTLLHR